MPIARPTFLNVRRAARILGLPVAWLRDEAKAGNIPCIRVGRSIRLNVDDVEQALKERAQRPADPPA